MRDVSMEMDRTMDIANLKSLDLPLEGQLNGSKAEGNCCARFFAAFNTFIWRNEAELMKIDHLKAAPCVSTRFLAVLRIILSLALVAQTIACIIQTSAGSSSFFFISQWNLLLITTLFILMAIV